MKIHSKSQQMREWNQNPSAPFLYSKKQHEKTNPSLKEMLLWNMKMKNKSVETYTKKEYADKKPNPEEILQWNCLIKNKKPFSFEEHNTLPLTAKEMQEWNALNDPKYPTTEIKKKLYRENIEKICEEEEERKKPTHLKKKKTKPDIKSMTALAILHWNYFYQWATQYTKKQHQKKKPDHWQMLKWNQLQEKREKPKEKYTTEEIKNPPSSK